MRLAVVVSLVAVTFVARQDPAPGATFQDLIEGLKHPSRWLTYSGDYTGKRHSPLTEITVANVHRLTARWTFQTGTMTRGRGFEATPLVWDGVLYVTGSNNFAWAIDARTGRSFWQYRRELPADLTYGASAPVNRGFGMLGDRLLRSSSASQAASIRRGASSTHTIRGPAHASGGSTRCRRPASPAAKHGHRSPR